MDEQTGGYVFQATLNDQFLHYKNFTSDKDKKDLIKGAYIALINGGDQSALMHYIEELQELWEFTSAQIKELCEEAEMEYRTFYFRSLLREPNNDNLFLPPSA